MKKFTQEQMLKFVSSFHLVHGYTSKLSFTPNGRIFFNGQHPLALVLMEEKYIPKFVDLEKLGSVMYTPFPWLPETKRYFLFNYIDSSKYTGTPEQENFLNYWYDYSQKYAENYTNRENISNYKEIEAQLSSTLLVIAAYIWNQITYDSEEINNFYDCTNKDFWKAYSSAKYFIKLKYPEEEKNMTIQEFEECIINSFENIDDVIEFENYMLSVPTTIRGESNTETEHTFWIRILEKIIPKFSLSQPTPIIQSYITKLNDNPNGYYENYTNEMLNAIEYCSYDLTKDFYHNLLNDIEYEEVSDRIQKIITKFEK